MKSLFVTFIGLFIFGAARASTPLATNCADLATVENNHIVSNVNFDVSARVVFECPQEDGLLSLQDATGAAIIHRRPVRNAIRVGDLIHASGYRAHGMFFADQICVLAHEEPMRPPTVSIADVLRGRHDYLPVTIVGTVRDSFQDEIDSAFRGLVLTTGDQMIYASFHSTPSNDLDVTHFCGAQVSLTGICQPGPHANRRFLGRTISICSPDDIKILKSASANIFDVPTIDVLAGEAPTEIAKLGRRRIQGRVSSVWSTNHILLKTLNGKISLIKTHLPQLPKPGTCIEVSGFPETDLYHINLSQADWRPAPDCAVENESPREITARSVLSEGVNASIQPRLHGILVKIKGVVRSKADPTIGSYRLYLESDSTLVPIQVDSAAILLPNLELDSTIEATGVCVMDIEHWSPSNPFPKITGFFVVTRSPEDIVVVARPSWWTPARLMAVIGGLVALIVVILVWNVSLRVLAERRGRALFKARIGNATAKLKVEERTHLAIELHDTIAQNLTGVSMELASAADLGEGASPEMLHHLGIATKALKSCRDELRYCLFDLRNQALEEPNFATAVERTLQPHLNGAKLSVRFNVPRKELHDNTAQAILRAIRELAVNAIRHGKATSIKVAGELDADGLRCSVRDNGCGFDPDTCPGVLQGHFGLQGVRERIEGLGGTFDISSTPGKGTKAVITVFSPKVTDEQNS